MRIGGIYSLARIAEDSERDYWTIMEILAAYIRENDDIRKRPDYPDSELQAAFDVIGRRRHPNWEDPEDRLNLATTNFSGAGLMRADFSHVSLQNATFTGAHVEAANFNDADLSGAVFECANISSADFSNARGLDSKQLSKACGNAEPKLPAGHDRNFGSMRDCATVCPALFTGK